MIDKRPKTPREVAAFSLFSMAEEAAWSDGALHHYLSRAGLDSRDAALASRLTYGTVQNQILLDWYLRHFSSVRLKKIAPRVIRFPRMRRLPRRSRWSSTTATQMTARLPLPMRC